jgi:peptide/nickel transport system substrate-binding protein
MFGLKYLVGVLSLVGMARTDAETIMVGQTFLARSQNATDGSAGWALTSHGVGEKLFTVDKNGEIVPQVAKSVEKLSTNVWEVTLKSGYKFSDGTTVDAEHVAKCLQELNDKNGAATSSLGKMIVTAVEGKVRIESEKVSHAMDAVLAEWVFVVYRVDDEGNFVYTGPYVIKHFAPGDHIDLVPNSLYDGASTRTNFELKQMSGEHMAGNLTEGKLDIAFHLPIDTVADVRKAKGVRIKSFEVGYHYMMFHNTHRLEDVRVRKAIDLAIDRTALSQELKGGKGTRSLFPDYTPFYTDDSDPHGDPEAAAKLLDEAGWKLNSSGKREKDGTVLSIHLVAYPHRPGLAIMQPVIAESLKDLGMDVDTTLTSMDWDETAKIMNDRTFDLLMWAQHTLPAGDPLWFLNNFFHSDSGSNHARIASDEINADLDKLSVAEGHSARVKAAKTAHETILDLTPVSNLVTPFWHVGLSDRMKDYEPWGSDYYVIRAEMFEDEDATTETDSSDVGRRSALVSAVASFFVALLFA